MFWIFKRKTQEKWALCKTFTVDGISYDKKSGKVYISLFESDAGNRKIENASTFPNLEKTPLNVFVKSLEIYNEKVYRWLHGRHDPDIPRYSQVAEEDVVNALKGSIE